MLSAALGILGLIVGSFLNVVIIRHGAKPLTGRSSCLSCAAQIRWYDNIPVLSWMLLRGRCRSCRSSISVQYPLVEALTGFLFALILPVVLRATDLGSPLGLVIVAADAAIIALLVAIAVYDARHTIIPDGWAIAFSGLALLVALSTHVAPAYITLLAGPSAALPLFALWLVSGGRWMGLGDAKIALGFGWFLGPVFGIVSVFLAFVIGALVSVCILLPLPLLLAWLRKRGIARLSSGAAHFTMKSEVAFGPFLVASFFFTWLSLLYHVPLPLPL